MRSYYVRRKDLDHVPFQFYVTADGTALPLESGYTGVFAILPPKNDIDVFYVRILDEFISEMKERWEIGPSELLRIAAQGVAEWLTNAPIPPNHFYGPEWLKIDRDWYPRDPDGAPAMAVDPYSFDVVSDDPWPSILDWDFSSRAESQDREQAESDRAAGQRAGKNIVFGFTMDVFPAMLILGYEQMKSKVEQAGLAAQVKMAPLADLPPALDVLLVPAALAGAAREAVPAARVCVLEDRVNPALFDSLLQEIEHKGEPVAEELAPPV